MATTVDTKNQFDVALKAILYGPGIKNLNLNGHEFNIKQATIVLSLDGLTVQRMCGQLSHRISGDTDDQIYYDIPFTYGKPVITEKCFRSVKGGVWGDVFKGSISLMSSIIPFGKELNFSSDLLKSALNRIIEHARTGSWGDRAVSIIIYAALNAQARVGEISENNKIIKQLNVALKAMLFGPEKKGHELNGHKFNVKVGQIIRGKDGKIMQFKGQISHCLSKTGDDQIYYDIPYINGEPQIEEHIKIKKGTNYFGLACKGFAIVISALAVIFTAGAAAVVLGATVAVITMVPTIIEKLKGGGWEEQVYGMITYGAVAALDINDIMRGDIRIMNDESFDFDFYKLVEEMAKPTGFGSFFTNLINSFFGDEKTITITVEEGTATVRGKITGNLILIKKGKGALLLTQENDYKGKTIVEEGTIIFNKPENFGTSKITINNGTLQWADGCAGDIFSRFNGGQGNVVLDIGSNQVQIAASLNWESLVKKGDGKLIIRAANSFSKEIIVSEGTLELTRAGKLSGAVRIEKGLIIFNTLDNFVGGSRITINDGTLQWADGCTADISSRLVGGKGKAVFDIGLNQVTFSSTLSLGSLAKKGYGKLILKAAGSFSQEIVISEGTLELTGSGKLSGSVYIENASLILSDSSSLEEISGIKMTKEFSILDISQMDAQSTAVPILTGSGETILGGKTLRVGENATKYFSYSGKISGNGTIEKRGGIGMGLSGNNSGADLKITDGEIDLATDWNGSVSMGASGNPVLRVCGGRIIHGSLSIEGEGIIAFGLGQTSELKIEFIDELKIEFIDGISIPPLVVIPPLIDEQAIDIGRKIKDLLVRQEVNVSLGIDTPLSLPEDLGGNVTDLLGGKGDIGFPLLVNDKPQISMQSVTTRPITMMKTSLQNSASAEIRTAAAAKNDDIIIEEEGLIMKRVGSLINTTVTRSIPNSKLTVQKGIAHSTVKTVLKVTADQPGEYDLIAANNISASQFSLDSVGTVSGSLKAQGSTLQFVSSGRIFNPGTPGTHGTRPTGWTDSAFDIGTAIPEWPTREPQIIDDVIG